MKITKILEGIVDLEEEQEGLGFVVRDTLGKEHFVQAPEDVVSILINIFLQSKSIDHGAPEEPLQNDLDWLTPEDVEEEEAPEINPSHTGFFALSHEPTKSGLPSSDYADPVTGVGTF